MQTIELSQILLDMKIGLQSTIDHGLSTKTVTRVSKKFRVIASTVDGRAETRNGIKNTALYIN